ncbi:MAG: hypothetical protein ACRDQF_09420 [Thermocrispum sp.]
MDNELIGPWILIGGYAVAIGFLFLAIQFEKRQKRARGRARARWKSLLKGCWAAMGFVASATTLFWATGFTMSGPLVVLWAAVPVAVGLLIWWRKRDQGEWMDRFIAAGRGTYFTAERLSAVNAARPSFGVIPERVVRGFGNQARVRLLASVELGHQGHELMGVQYLAETGDAAELDDLSDGVVVKTAKLANTYNLAQLRTPTVPTLVVRPRLARDRQAEYGALATGPIRPFEETRLDLNTGGVPVLDAELERVRLDDHEFDKMFAVRGSDPTFVRAVFTPEMTTRWQADAWFRVSGIMFHDGVLMTPRHGQLTEDAFVDNTRRLAELAAAVPAEAWSHGGPSDDAEGTLDADTFLSVLAQAEVSEQIWLSDRLDTTGLGWRIRKAINARYVAADRPPPTRRGLALLLALIAPALVLGGLWLTVLAIGTISSAEPQVSDTIFGSAVGFGMVVGGIVLAKKTAYPQRR